MFGWVVLLHALDWMIGCVIANHQEELQKCGNKLVCIIIPSGDQRLDLFRRFTAPGPYTAYVNPVISPFIVPVSAKEHMNTVKISSALKFEVCIKKIVGRQRRKIYHAFKLSVLKYKSATIYYLFTDPPYIIQFDQIHIILY